MAPAKKTLVENVHWPGRTTRLDSAKYEAMRAVLLAVLPADPPGLTQEEMTLATFPFLPADLFPRGSTAHWWAKTVQLDLEAKGLVARRSKPRPTRWFRAPSPPPASG